VFGSATRHCFGAPIRMTVAIDAARPTHTFYNAFATHTAKELFEVGQRDRLSLADVS
jgi:hypothetical protein